VPGGVVRREFVDRFPYVVIFVETEALRRVIMIRRGTEVAATFYTILETASSTA
jgi:hypothetical protein